MAKWGEGDPRWIVEERPDAFNVNNWHWTEKNATPWSKDRLDNLLTGREIENGPIKVKFPEIQKLHGEATANNRKGKLIFLYEWEIELSFQAFVAGSDIEYSGTIEILNLSDENSADEIDLTTTINTHGEHEAEIRHFLCTQVRDEFRRILAVYISELKEEFSKGLILPTGKVTKQMVGNNVNKRSFQNEVVNNGGQLNGKNGGGGGNSTATTSFVVTKDFKTRPEQLFQVFSDPKLIEKWSNSPAFVEFKEGGQFSIFNGMVSGVFQKIVDNVEIVHKWRLRNYPDGHFALISIKFTDNVDQTMLEMTAENVPESLAQDTKRGLECHYLNNILGTFGFGARLF